MALSFCACKGADRPGADPARDLTLALGPAAPTLRDTAAERADSQFRTCLYVYDTEERLRECLVLRSGWPAAVN